MPELAETMRIVMDIHESKLYRMTGITINDEHWMGRKLGDSLQEFREQTGMMAWATYGKNIFICFGNSTNKQENCESTYWELRLGMSGRFKIGKYMNEVDKKHIMFTLHHPNGDLCYIDYRKFFDIKKLVEYPNFKKLYSRSLLYLHSSRIHVNTDLDVTPITKKPKITEILAEGQHTGIGNYLANEGIGRSKMNPKTPFKDQDEKNFLYKVIQGVALESYAAGGNTFNGGYIRPNGKTGDFKPQVYGQAGWFRETFRGRTIYVQ